MKPDVTTTAMGQQPPTYDEVQVGIDLGPARLVIDEHLVASYVFAVEDHSAGPLAPNGDVTPAVLANELLLLYYYRYRQADCAAVHAHNTLRLHRPVVIGDRVTVRGRHVEKFVKRGLGYVVSETTATNDDGQLLASNRATEIMDGVTPDADAPRSGSVRDGGDGFVPRRELSKVARFDQVCVFSNIAKQQVNIHNDVAFAASRGFGRPVVQGMQQVCYLSELGRILFGPPFWSGGVIKTTFIRPLFADDAVTVQSAGSQISPGLDVVPCRVLDSAGRATTVGSLGVSTDREPGEPTPTERTAGEPCREHH
jgi:acyl dehydratase